MVLSEASDPSFSGRRRGRPVRPTDAPIHRRRCEQIVYREAVDFSEALHFARATLGREPNRHITIQWKHAPSPRSVPARLRRILNNTGTLIRRRKGEAAVWAYCREVGKLKGEHVHILIYVPESMWKEYQKMLRHWLECETDEPVRESAVKFQNVTPGTVQTELKGYFLKEGTEQVRFLWVKDRERHKPTGGVIEGKRLKVSHSIGTSARRAARAEYPLPETPAIAWR